MKSIGQNQLLAGVCRVCYLVLAIFAISPAAAQNGQINPQGNQFGEVGFTHSCDMAVSASFDRAVALLHSFWFAEAINTFQEVLDQDPDCAIAYWGIGLSHWGNPFAGGRTPDISVPAWENIQQGLSLDIPSERERDYLLAVAELHRDADEINQRTRVLRYEQAMQTLSQNNPDDSEAQIFYALAMTSAALPSDQTYSRQLAAAEILEREFDRNPEHPGVAHYLIHSYDVPPLASRGLEAARRYADIAPDAPHALHMPSHIFTRVGEWDSSVATNIRSADSARTAGLQNEVLHAYDYMIYAYLQMAQDASAREVLDDMDRYGTRNVFAVAAIPARYAIETENWDMARGLQVRSVPTAPQTEAISRFTRALGFAHSGEVESARREVGELEALRGTLEQRNDAYWAEQVEIQRLSALSAAAWVSHAEGDNEEALSLLRRAAIMEDGTEKAAVTPGPLKPVREQMGEILLALDRPEEALEAFEIAMESEPNRFLSVYGAARAARLADEQEAARGYYGQLLEISATADSERSQLDEARRFLE